MQNQELYQTPWPLEESLQLLQTTVQEFAQANVAPIAAKVDHDNKFPRELWPKMGQLGLHGITISPEFGGSKMGYLAHCIAMEELSRASGAIGLAYGAHSNLCMNQIELNASLEQKQKYLPKLCSGEWLGALAMSETEAGSDVMNMQLKAELTPDGKHFILNGHKMWITNGPAADVIILYAVTNPDPKIKPSQRLSAFILEKNTPGFHTAQKLDKLGMRGADTCELVFNNCKIPRENLLGQMNHGAKILMHGLNFERLVLAAGPVGLMQACLDLVVPYVKQRKQFGQSLSQFQLVQAHIADLFTELMAARSLLYSAAQTADQTQNITNSYAASVILYTAEKATKSALTAIQLLGGNGYINEYPAGRLLRDAKLYEIGAGTSEIRRLIIGKSLCL